MTLAAYTTPDLIIPSLDESDAAVVIRELSQALQREKRVPDFLAFYHAVLNREFLLSTEIEADMAFPHARIPGLSQVSFALGRSAKPLSWTAKSRGSVHLVFLLAVPESDSTQYPRLISSLARFAREGRLMEEIRAAEGSAQIFHVLQQFSLRNTPEPVKPAIPFHAK
jgi:mannitol/fructose-specific phosphotransferase system IIA component (Ntr-type)